MDFQRPRSRGRAEQRPGLWAGQERLQEEQLELAPGGLCPPRPFTGLTPGPGSSCRLHTEKIKVPLSGRTWAEAASNTVASVSSGNLPPSPGPMWLAPLPLTFSLWEPLAPSFPHPNQERLCLTSIRFHLYWMQRIPPPIPRALGCLDPMFSAAESAAFPPQPSHS